MINLHKFIKKYGNNWNSVNPLFLKSLLYNHLSLNPSPKREGLNQLIVFFLPPSLLGRRGQGG